MTVEIVLLLALLLAMAYLFLTEKLPVDLTAFLGLVILIFGGYVSPDQAFTGFASSAVITMLSIFIVSASLFQTGVADWLGGAVHKLVGERETSLIIVLMLFAGVLSAFMNNIAATAVMMPAVASVARRAQIPPAKLFMPLAFGAILGGTTTLVGTPPNILAAEMLGKRGAESFQLFDFTVLGLGILALGVIYMVFVGRRLIPVRERATGHPEGGDLTQVYQLHDRLFSIRVAPGSALDGAHLRDTHLARALGLQVTAILRGGRERFTPSGSTLLRADDVLFVAGRLEDLKELFQVRGVEVERMRTGDLPRPARGVSGLLARVPVGSPLIGTTLREFRLRDRFGVVVVALRRDKELVRQRLSSVRILEGDELLALGTREQFEELERQPSWFEVEAVGLSAVGQLQEDLFTIRVSKSSALVGQTLAASRIGHLVGLTVVGIVRDGVTKLGVASDEVIAPDDQLLIAGEPSRVLAVLELGDVQVDSEIQDPSIEFGEVTVIEASLAPRSHVEGKTLKELDFRARHGLQVLSIWREGKPIYDGLADIPLRFGDAMLLQGSREKIRRLASEADFVVLSQSQQAPRRTARAPWAIGALAAMIVLVVTGLQPIQVAAFTAATLAVLGGAITMQEAYRAVEWRAIFLVAAILPVQFAMEKSGTTDLLARLVTESASTLGPYFVLAILICLSSFLSQILDGAPAVVLLIPVVLATADQLGLSPRPFAMGVSLAASAAFMTPFSHKANLLVMGAGGYRTWDYVRVGTPLTILILAALVWAVPKVFPF